MKQSSGVISELPGGCRTHCVDNAKRFGLAKNEITFQQDIDRHALKAQKIGRSHADCTVY
jgi:hypothetical protein